MRWAVLVITACGASAHAPGDPAVHALADAHVSGIAVALDATTGAIVAHAGDIDARVMPLSLVKLFTAAVWWNHDFGDGSFLHPPGGSVDVADIIVDGWDRPGAELADELRRRLGGAVVVDELRALGLAVTLSPDAPDAAWGDALSIGEHDVQVTARAVATFLLGSKLHPGTARRMREAMFGAVERGSAKSIAGTLAGTSLHIGGKTGSGPLGVTPSDGWFAGIVDEGGKPRFTFAVFVARAGRGGGVAASIAVELARALH